MSTTERIEIIVSERGSRVVRKNVEDIGTGARGAAGGVDFLKRTLATLGIGVGLAEIIKTIDAFTNLQNRLRSTGLEGKNLTGVYQALLKVSNETRSSVEGSVELYSRLALSSKELGVSQKDLIQFTKSLNQAIILSGASATEAQAGLIQLSQGMASGTLRGDELRSVLEQLPAVADVIAKKLGVTRGELRQMGQDGKITAQTIIEAFKASREELEERFGKTVPTIGQSFQVLKNNIVDMFGRLNEATGISAIISKGLMLVASNLDTVAKGIASVVSGFLIMAGVTRIVDGVTTAVKALNVAIKTNPMGLLLTVLLSVITALTLFRDQIKLGIDDTTTLGDLMRAAWEGILPVLQAVGNAVATFFKWLGTTSAGTFGAFLDDLVGVEHQSESTWLKMLRVVVKVFDMIGAVVRGTFAGIAAVAVKVVGNIGDNFVTLGKAIKAAMVGNFEDAAKLMTMNKSAFEGVGEAFGKAMREQMDAQAKGGLEAVLDSTIKRAQEIGKARKAAEDANKGAVSDVAPPAVALPTGGDGKGKKGKDAKKELADSLEQLVGQYDKVYAAQMELKKATELLDKAEAAGLITKERRAEVLGMINDQLRDQLDPLGAVNRELKKEADLLALSSKEREIQTQLMQIEQDLRASGKKLTEEETAALKAQLIVQQELAKISGIRDQLENDTAEARINAIKDQLIAFSQITTATDTDKSNFLDQLLGGTQDDWASQFAARMQQIGEFNAAVNEYSKKQNANEQLASAARIQIAQMERDAKLDMLGGMFGQLTVLMQTNSKKAFKIGQAAAIGEALVNTYKGVSGAISNAFQLPYPVNLVAAAVGSAAAIAAGIAQVSKIRSQQMPGYRTGGEYVVGGHGGVDSQNVAFRATPGERISINTPQQAHAMQNVERMMRQGQSSEGPRFTQNLTIVQQGRPDRRTPEQNARAQYKQGAKLVGA